MTLWYLGSQSTLIDVADRFGATELSVIRSRKKVSKALMNLRSRIIVLSKGEQMQNTVNEFESLKGFPGVVGALDVRIAAPFKHYDQYINMKGFYSLQLQCVCGPDMQFLHSYVGWPGSVHDAHFLRNSDHM